MAAVNGEERRSSIKDMQPGLCPAEDSVPFNEGTEPQISSSSTVNEKRELPSKADILKADPSESQWRRPSVTHKLNDVCADLFLEADELGQQRLEELNRRVKWKLDLIIMPIVACTHALQFLNKSSPNFVAALGIIPELGLQHGRYAWVRRHMTSTLFLHTDKEPGRRHIQFWLRCMVVPDQHDYPTCTNCQVYRFCRAGLVSDIIIPKIHASSRLIPSQGTTADVCGRNDQLCRNTRNSLPLGHVRSCHRSERHEHCIAVVHSR